MQILDRTNCKRFIAYGKGKSTELNLELIPFIHSFLVFTIPTLFVWSTGVWVGIMNMIIGSVGILIGLLVFWNDEFELLVFWTWSLCLLVFWNDEFELLVFWNDEFKGWYYELSLLVFWKGLIGILKGSVGILKRSVGILKGSVGILKGSIGILKSSVGILKGSVGILIHWYYEHWYFERWYFEPLPKNYIFWNVLEIKVKRCWKVLQINMFLVSEWRILKTFQWFTYFCRAIYALFL